LRGPPGLAPDPHRLRLPRLSAAEGLPDDRLRRSALRRRAQAGGLRAGQADPGIPPLRLPVPVGRRPLRAAGAGLPLHAAWRRKGDQVMADEHVDVPEKLAERTVEEGGALTEPVASEIPVRKFNINFGPQHPAAHGVLRLVLELD